MSPAPLIELTGLSRSWMMGDTEVHALAHIDLAIHEGEFVAIVGPSGSGKTTLMYLLGLLDRPSGGSYRLDGREVASLGDRQRSRLRNRSIGYVFQQYHLLPGLSVVDNIGLGLAYAGETRHARRAAGERFAAQLGLAHRTAHTPRELSGGQMQRVAIARGLACRPRLILADEPTGNLDSKTGAEIMALLRELHGQGHTIVLVTHDPTVARQASRMVRIVDGAIVSDERVESPPAVDAGLGGAAPAAAPAPGGEAALAASAAEAPRPQPSAAAATRVLIADLLRMALHEGILAHKLRSALTMLGIVFGIASVIAMTAITEGGKRSQLEQLRQIGMNSIQVRTLDLAGPRLMRARRANPRGLTADDLGDIVQYLPGVTASTAWKSVRAELRAGEHAVEDASTLGVLGDFQEVANFHVGEGRFLTPRDGELRARACVLGAAIADALGLGGQPCGKIILVGDEPFTVVGVMGRKRFSESEIADISVPDRNREVYIPYATLRSYFRHEERESELDAISLRMDTDARLLERSQMVKRILDGLHDSADDVAVAVPLESLKQAQRTKEVFDIIIVVIAAISLIVGGIGIMNIMLASVTERTREIGIRRAVGASRTDILGQFLCESALISSLGGALGLALGIVAGLAIQAVFGFPVAFVWWIMAVAVASSMAIGIGFGIYPAHLAARMDPVEALRS